MAKNPFVILGVSEDCTQNELYDAYRALRDKYADMRFEPGEVGEEACVKLEEVEAAYKEATEILRSRYDISYTGDNLDDADRAIKDGNLDEAQKILDDCATRTAHWHYLQAAIFYRKGWPNDALKQLDFACQMEPTNQKYIESRKTLLDHLNANTTAQRSSFYNGENAGERSYSGMEGERNARGCTVCDCCSSLLCADCCCECMGGDLISCC